MDFAVGWLLWLALTAQGSDASLDQQAAKLRQLIADAPRLDHAVSAVVARPPHQGWEMGMVSWIAVDENGLRYLLQRGDGADPIVVLDSGGAVVRSWGKGLYETPHAIRIDPDGNVWTADAKSSRVIKYTALGEELLRIEVGGQPADCDGRFCGTSDVGFGPDGRIFIADGYRNARILEYTADGRRVREWGRAGEGPGEFRLPHSLAVDDSVVYVADRENGRVQRFDLDGNYLGMWTDYGKTFGLVAASGAVWLATQHRNEPNLSPGWLLKVDRRSGELLGYVPVTGVHGMAVAETGDLFVAPGPDNRPQAFEKR